MSSITRWQKRRLYPTCVCYHGCVRHRAEALVFRETVADIKSHVTSLRVAGYRFLLPSDYKRWQEGAVHYDEPVTCLHYDDCLGTIDLIIPWLIGQGIPCGIAIITRRLGRFDPEDGFARWSQVRDWAATGLVEVMSHTHNLHHLTLLRNSEGAIDVGPVLEGPCWMDDGDVVYRAPGDARWYWDFTHVDAITLGLPLWGTDPYDGVTPVVTTMTMTPKATGTVTVLRLWMALSKPSGAGYDVQVQIRAGGVLVWEGVIAPKVYETRSQWVEREFHSIELATPFAAVSGTPLALEFTTLNTGIGVALLYGLATQDDAAFRAVTNCQGLYAAGSQGWPDRYWQYIDYPAGDRWPIKPCIVLGFGTGRDATIAEYQAYVAADCQAAAEAVAQCLPATWDEVVAFRPSNAGTIVGARDYVPTGWNAPNRVDAIINLRPVRNVRVEYIKLRVGSAEYFDGGDAYWPFNWGGQNTRDERDRATQRSYPATFELAIGSDAGGWTVIGQAAIWRISKGLACDVTPFDCPTTGLQLRVRPINAGPTVGEEQRTRWGVSHVLLGERSTPVPAPAPNQIVYPFGSYNGADNAVVQIRPGFKDISAELRAVFAAAGLTHGYTIQAVRNIAAGELREPDLRQTEYALGRWLVYGDQDPGVSLNNLAAVSGYLLHDVQHRGVEWQASMEADPLGNATIKARPQVLDYVAFDAWAFDGAGAIAQYPCNNGGTYGGVVYPDDKAWLQARGVRCLLILNNNLGTGEPDAAIGDHVVANPTTYVPLIVATAVDGGWDGITCNLEALSVGSRGAATAFYRQLARALHAAGKLLHATVPAATGTDYDADWWTGWCDHGEIAKVCDGIKVMSYTESGPGSAPGPAAPAWFWDAVYARIRAVVPEPYWPRVLCGCRAFGHLWDMQDTTDATYITYHAAIAGALNYGQRLDVRDTEIGWGKGDLRAWCGTPLTVDRAQREAATHGFGGLGLWKLDDADIEEFFPLHQQIGREQDMAYLDIQFPPNISYGSSGGPEFVTDIMEMQSGDESRNARWTMPLHRYDASLKVRTLAELEEIRALFMVAMGRRNTFRFRDWSDYRVKAQPIAVTDGVTTNFQLVRTYAIQGYTLRRPITKPVQGTVRMLLDGVEHAGWTLNASTGLVSFTTAPASGRALTADYEFDVHVRFDVDSLPTELLARGRASQLLLSPGTITFREERRP